MASSQDVSDLDALLNPDTNPNIYYMSPATQPPASSTNKNGMTLMHLNGFKEERKAEMNDNVAEEELTDMTSSSDSATLNIHHDNPMDAMPIRPTAHVVDTPPNSTRTGSNAPKSHFNFKRLSKRLSQINVDTIKASISSIYEGESDIDEEESGDYTDIDNDVLDAKQSHVAHLNKIIDSLKYLQKELPHLVELNMNEDSHIIQIRIPNTKYYKTWDVNDIMFWIQHLENGRYQKYEQQLMNGFRQSEFNAEELPELQTAHLGAPPFNIKIFRDKRDLIKHFKKLKQEQ